MRKPKPAAVAAKLTKKRGPYRPRHTATEESTATVMRLDAIGHTQEDIASALGIARGVLLAHYGKVLKTAKMVVRAQMVNALFNSAVSGNVSAQKKVIEMTGDDGDYRIPNAPQQTTEVEVKAPKAKPLGKKEEAALAAANPDVTTSMGALMAARNSATPH